MEYLPLRIPKGEGYLHYWWENYVSNGTDFGNDFSLQGLDSMQLWSQTKSQIIAGAGTEAVWNIMSQYESVGGSLSDEQLDLAEFVISGVAVEGMGSDSVLSQTQRSAGGGSPEGLVSSFAALRQSIEQGSKYEETLDNLVSAFQEDKNLYAEVEDFVKSNMRTARQLRNTTVQRIVSRIISQKNGRLFARPQTGSIAHLSEVTQKWLILLYSLSEGKMDRSSAKMVRQFIKQLSLEKMNKVQSDLALAADSYGQVKAQQVGIKGIKELNDSLSLTFGGKDGIFISDPSLEADLLSIEADMKKANSNFAYSSTGITAHMTDSDTGAVMDVSVGGIRTLEPQMAAGTDMGIGDFRIENSKSLMNILLDDLALPATEIDAIKQLAGAVDTGYGLDDVWNSLKDYVTYGLLVSSITGARGEVANTYIKINDDLIPTISFLNYLLVGVSPQTAGSFSAKLEGWQGREAYSSRTSSLWVGSQDKAEADSASQRSDAESALLWGALSGTKLTLMLDGVNLAAIASIAQR